MIGLSSQQHAFTFIGGAPNVAASSVDMPSTDARRTPAAPLAGQVAATGDEQQHPRTRAMTFDERLARLGRGGAGCARDRACRASARADEAPAQSSGDGRRGAQLPRRADRPRLRRIATFPWIEDHHRVLISGATAPARRTSRAHSPTKQAPEAMVIPTVARLEASMSKVTAPVPVTRLDASMSKPRRFPWRASALR